VFVVGHLGDWRRAAAVLFERESLSGYPAPRREAGQKPAPTLGAGPVSGGRKYGTDADSCDGLVPLLAKPLGAHALSKGRGTDLDCTTYVAEPVPYDLAGITSVVNRSNPEPGAPCHTLHKGAERSVIAFSAKDHGADAGDISPTLRAGGHHGSHANDGQAIQSGMQVRRLTPMECERLQGFPDGYTAIGYRGKPAADGPRYKALGNSMAVPCMAWIGRRIKDVDSLDVALGAVG
jgi:DNA (cytosine-5)-methyltransferase 1